MITEDDLAMIQQLQSSLAANHVEDRLFLASDEQYQSSLNSYFSNQERCLTPAAIARPRISQDVCNLVKGILHLRRNTGLGFKFAVRSGGHYVWPGAANIDKGLTIVNEELLNSLFGIWEKTVPEVENIPGICWAIGFQVIHPSTTSKSAPLGGNCMGLAEAPALVIVVLTNFWESGSDNEAMVAKSKSLLASLEAEAKRRDVYSPFKYLNYAWGDQDIFAGYGADNKARL